MYMWNWKKCFAISNTDQLLQLPWLQQKLRKKWSQNANNITIFNNKLEHFWVTWHVNCIVKLGLQNVDSTITYRIYSKTVCIMCFYEIYFSKQKWRFFWEDLKLSLFSPCKNHICRIWGNNEPLSRSSGHLRNSNQLRVSVKYLLRSKVTCLFCTCDQRLVSESIFIILTDFQSSTFSFFLC